MSRRDADDPGLLWVLWLLPPEADRTIIRWRTGVVVAEDIPRLRESMASDGGSIIELVRVGEAGLSIGGLGGGLTALISGVEADPEITSLLWTLPSLACFDFVVDDDDEEPIDPFELE